MGDVEARGAGELAAASPSPASPSAGGATAAAIPHVVGLAEAAHQQQQGFPVASAADGGLLRFGT